jgi:hypothetical protein
MADDRRVVRGDDRPVNLPVTNGHGLGPDGFVPADPWYARTASRSGGATTLEAENARLSGEYWRVQRAEWLAAYAAGGRVLAACMVAHFADFYVNQRVMIVHKSQLFNGPLGMPSSDRWKPRELREFTKAATVLAEQERPAFESSVAGARWSRWAAFFEAPVAGKEMPADLRDLGQRPLVPLVRLLIDFGLTVGDDVNLFRSEYWPHWLEREVDTVEGSGKTTRREGGPHPVVAAFGRLSGFAARLDIRDRK